MNVFSRACAAALALTALSGPVRADLGADAARLTKVWRLDGEVRRLEPRLAERGAPTVVFLASELAQRSPRACSSVAILGPSSTHFSVRAVGAAPSPDDVDDFPVPSLAGLVQLTRCGQGRARLSTLLIEMRSPRAVIETIVVESQTAVRSAVEVLPHRNPGPLALPGGSSPRPEPPPMPARLASLEARSKREGAARIERFELPSSPRGAGTLRRLIEAGCHRLDLLASAKNAVEDDFELAAMPEIHDALSVVSIDRGDGLDTSLTFCAGDRSPLAVEYAGAPRNAQVSAVLSSWPLPDGLSDAWGATGRARVAATLRRHAAPVEGAPVFQALGVQGPTLMPAEVEPGACYVAVLVAVRGSPQGLALAAVSGATSAQNHGGQGGEGTLVSFCARSSERVLFEADSRGVGLFWLFALFQNGRVAIGEQAL